MILLLEAYIAVSGNKMTITNIISEEALQIRTSAFAAEAR